jgi:hypothetical protein
MIDMESAECNAKHVGIVCVCIELDHGPCVCMQLAICPEYFRL